MTFIQDNRYFSYDIV